MLGSPCQGPRTGLPPPISNAMPSTPPPPYGLRLHGDGRTAHQATSTPPTNNYRGGATSNVEPGATASGDTHLSLRIRMSASATRTTRVLGDRGAVPRCARDG